MYLGGLCFITDRKVCSLSYEGMVRLVLESGVKWVQYRDKEGSRLDIYRNALNLRSITRDHNAVFIVNDHTDIALAVDADGVHLGQDDLPAQKAREILGKNRLIGISTHTIEQAVHAEASGADYIGFGPIFRTETKDAGSPKGVAMLDQLRSRIHIPIVAIGGINLENVRSVLATGIDAVAVASAILRTDIKEHARRFLEIIHSPGG
ncbi:MAG: thiamine phosphate synthase [Nitrospirota bacterium]